ERSSDRPGDSSQVLGDHLKALCLADFGEYLCKVALDPREGARRFREADEELAGAGPAPFRVYIKCREADCWLELNRWADADAALEIATDSARVFDLHEPQSLSAYAFSRCGWARMSQWKIQEARSWFVRSNEILGGMMDEGGAARWSPTARPNAIVSLPPNRPNDQNEHVAAMETSGDDAIDRGIGSTRPTPLRADVFAVPEFVRRSKDFDAQTLYFHNLHGLAMTLRFSDPRADGTTAAIEYRGLAREIEAALSQVQARQAGVQEDAEAGLIERYVNTLERLGDCSLLGNPALRDPDEAADDFRRAEARAHLLRTRREDRRAKLLYKRAIALSLPSAGRDVELAESLRAAADALVGKTLVPAPSANTAASSSIAGTAPSAASAAGGAGPAPAPVATFTQITSAARATAELATLSRLTPHLVALLKCTSFPEINRAAQSKAAAELRQAIEEHRRELGAKIHRDQLELCLLAAHVLLEYGGETDRLLLRCDADLLTDFCRSNLSPYGDEPSDRDADERDAAESSESLAYLRPFYDAVFRSRLRVDSKQVHELLELHWEATRGTCYQKPKQPRPILAVYILDDRCHMLLDLPRAGGVYAALPNRAADLRKTDHFAPLDAPPEITRALQRWRLEQADVGTETIAIECRWEDPLHQVSARNSAVVETSSSTGSHGGKPATGGRVPRRRFPFQLPEGFCEPEDLAPGSRTAARP
ncbi:MAG TPA: hypothetical protein VGE52_13680, partial [Pirellulales bacterium]